MMAHQSRVQTRKIDVVAGIILNESHSRVLMSQRTDIPYRGKWEFPGGKIELNESRSDALRREIKEEIDIDVSQYELFFEKNHQYPEKTVVLSFYLIFQFHGHPRALESQPIQWQPISSLHELDALEANVDVIAAIREKFIN